MCHETGCVSSNPGPSNRACTAVSLGVIVVMTRSPHRGGRSADASSGLAAGAT